MSSNIDRADKLIRVCSGIAALAKCLTTGSADLDTARKSVDAIKAGRDLYGDLSRNDSLRARMTTAAQARRDALARSSEYASEAGRRTLADAHAHCLQVIEYTVPEPEEIAAAGLKADCLVAAMLKAAASHEAFAQQTPDNVNVVYFREIARAVMTPLLDDTEFVASLTPALWRKALESFDELRDMVRAIYEERNKVEQPISLSLTIAQKLALRLGANTDEFLNRDRLARFLESKAAEQVELRTRLVASSDKDDPLVRQLRSEAAALIDAGEFEAADAKLANAEARDEKLEHEQEEALHRQKLSRAKSRAERGDVAKLRLDYREAAAHYAAAAEIAPKDDTETQWRYQIERAAAFHQLGDAFGDNAALEEAIALYRSIVLPLASREEPDKLAGTWNNLGNTLAVLGARGSGSARLKEAVAAFRCALDVLKPGTAGWALVQNNLGSTLSALGQRETGTERLREAVVAHRLALGVYSLDDTPHEWADTKNSLGVALKNLGERDTGTQYLEAAAGAFRAARRVQYKFRDRSWLNAVLNLAGIFTEIGRREDNARKVKLSIVLIKWSLEAVNKSEEPYLWASAHLTLGNAFRTLGTQQFIGAIAADRYEQAIEAYTSALTVFKRHHHPMDWAKVQYNLGLVYECIAERGAGKGWLENAVEAHRAALGVLEVAAPHLALKCAQDLAEAEILLAEPPCDY